MRPPPERGASRLPHTGSASAYPMRQGYYSILCRNWQDVRRAFPQGKAKRKSPVWGIDKRWKAGIMKIRGGAAGRREPPHDITVVTVKRVRLGRLLLFYLENQRNDADDQNAELKQVGISHHDTTPLRCSGGGKRSAASSRERGPRLPHTGSASAYPMRQEYYSILCRNWQDVRRAFPQGKAKRKSPMWGIDKRWKAGIMKIRGGAAGRREPLGDYLKK